MKNSCIGGFRNNNSNQSNKLKIVNKKSFTNPKKLSEDKIVYRSRVNNSASYTYWNSNLKNHLVHLNTDVRQVKIKTLKLK